MGKIRDWIKDKPEITSDHEFHEAIAERVLTSAVNDFLGYDKGKVYIEAKQWIFEETKEGVTFVLVCETLKINPEKLRFLVNCKKDEGKRRLRDLEFNDLLDLCIEEGEEE
jgi:hypothetical protein